MRSIWTRLGAAVGCLVVVALLAAGPAAADWTGTQLGGSAGDLFLLSVSCPTASFCAASGTQNVIATSTDPTGGASAWGSVYVGAGRQPEGEVGPIISGRQVQSISCPSARLCVAVTTLGQIYSSTDPTGPASAWNVTELESKGGNLHLYGVSCPTESFCVAVSGRRVNTGKVFSTTDPTGGASAWHEADLAGEPDLRAVSCASTSLCVATGEHGEIVASREPGGEASAWAGLGTPGGGSILQSVSCVPGICLSGMSGGNLLVATEPTAPGGWRESGGGASVQITGTSCASASACVAVDNNGDVTVSTDPTGAHPGWTSTNIRPYGEGVEEEEGSEDANALFGASCPTLGLCVAVGSNGGIFTSTDPFAAPTAAGGKGGGSGSGGGAGKGGAKRPRVKIAKLRLRRLDGSNDDPAHQIKLMARFYAKGPVRRFECRLDHGWHDCHSPYRRKRIGHGVHRLSVRAVGRTGLHGPAATKRIYVGTICRGPKLKECRPGYGEFPKGWTFR